MPLGYKLTEEQKDLVHGEYWREETSFNVVKDINDIWFLPDFLSDTPLIAESDYAWVVELPIEYFEPYVNNDI
jgi:hypothetical protein